MGEKEVTRTNYSFGYEFSDKLLYRVCRSSHNSNWLGKKYLVVPAECRHSVFRVPWQVYSPIKGQTWRLVSTFTDHVCGLMGLMYEPSVGLVTNASMSVEGCLRLVPLPIITEPFVTVTVDIVGPLSLNRYILTLIDFSTIFSKADPLQDIISICTVIALLTIFSRVGTLHKILSDQDTQFTSQMMAELHRFLRVKSLFTTPYHPSGNGRLERFHSTLKSSLRKLCYDKHWEWHHYQPTILFALQMSSDRIRFSAHELLFGRAVRGPVSILWDLWEDSKLSEDERSCFQYVIDLIYKLADCSKIAAQNAKISTTRYKWHFDLNSEDR